MTQAKTTTKTDTPREPQPAIVQVSNLAALSVLAALCATGLYSSTVASRMARPERGIAELFELAQQGGAGLTLWLGAILGAIAAASWLTWAPKSPKSPKSPKGQRPQALPAKIPPAQLTIAAVIMVAFGCMAIGSSLSFSLVFGEVPKTTGVLDHKDGALVLVNGVSLEQLKGPDAKDADKPLKDGPRVASARVLNRLALFPEGQAVTLNGQPVTRPSLLKAGDQLRVGEREYRFNLKMADMSKQLGARALATFLTALGVIAATILLVPNQGRPRFDAAGLTQHSLMSEIKRGLRLYFAFLPALVVLVLITNVVLDKAGFYPVPHAIQAMLAKFSPGALFFAFLTVVVAAPLSEELIFRGLLFPALADHMPVKAAIVATALIFGSVHTGLHAFVPIFAAGLFFTWLTATAPQRSITASMTAHLCHNAVAFSLFYVTRGLVPQ